MIEPKKKTQEVLILFFSLSDVCESGLLRLGDFKLRDDDLLFVGVIEVVLVVDRPDFLGVVFSSFAD